MSFRECSHCTMTVGQTPSRSALLHTARELKPRVGTAYLALIAPVTGVPQGMKGRRAFEFLLGLVMNLPRDVRTGTDRVYSFGSPPEVRTPTAARELFVSSG